ncbi:hypothetical protein HAX54_044445, partial [Datura stramonium]|nr:hypothetical protein [Datura stramonium]
LKVVNENTSKTDFKSHVHALKTEAITITENCTEIEIPDKPPNVSLMKPNLQPWLGGCSYLDKGKNDDWRDITHNIKETLLTNEEPPHEPIEESETLSNSEDPIFLKQRETLSTNEDPLSYGGT